jgi:hypothetical protein
MACTGTVGFKTKIKGDCGLFLLNAAPTGPSRNQANLPTTTSIDVAEDALLKRVHCRDWQVKEVAVEHGWNLARLTSTIGSRNSGAPRLVVFPSCPGLFQWL